MNFWKTRNKPFSKSFITVTGLRKSFLPAMVSKWGELISTQDRRE